MKQFLPTSTTILLVLFTSWSCRPPSAPSELNSLLGSNIDTRAFTQVDGTHELNFPVDHGPHNDFLFEWWYLTAILNDQKGGAFGVQFTIFRRALSTDNSSSNPWRTGQLYMGHFAISDVREKTHWADERFSREHPSLAGAQIEPFEIYIEDWKLAAQSSSFFPLELTAGTSDFRVSLSINRGKPMVLHGTNGYSQKSAEHASYYYSYTRLPTVGKLEINEEEYSVSGYSWLDREWSSQILSDPYRGWYWFSLNFEDDRELVLFELHSDDKDTKTVPTAMWIEPDGSSSHVFTENWSITPRRYWKSYPVEWTLEMDNIIYRISAKFDNQVMNTSVRYWEGIVEIRVAGAIVGQGYMELTGYE